MPYETINQLNERQKSMRPALSIENLKILHNWHLVKMFGLGFIQLLFLSANMYYISTTNYFMLIITAFATNMFFSYAMSKLAISSTISKMIYSAGCTGGCILGTWIASRF